MFPHTITIYHHDIINGVDNYKKTVLDGFYYSGGKTLSGTDKGIDSKGKVTIISNAENAHNFGVSWTVSVKDRIVIGVGKDIKSFKELGDAITVTDVAVNVCNSDVDNIVISGV
mgnify:CR=1 FL=1